MTGARAGGRAGIAASVVASAAACMIGCAQRGGGAPNRETVPTAVLDPGTAHAGSGSGADRGRPDATYRLGPAGFPIPKDAATVEDTPPDHTFKVPRPLDGVIGELKVDLALLGFKIEDEYVEDALHTHWYITRTGVTYEVSVAGDETDHTLIIVTVD